MKSFLVLILALMLWGCSAAPSFTQKVTFYYPIVSSDPKQLIAEYPVEGSGKATEELMTEYFAMQDETLIKSFPANVTVSSLKLKEDHATLVLSDEFAVLGGIDLTLACVAITKTVSALTDVTTVTIGCQTALLDGEQSLTFTENSFMWTDAGTPSMPPEESTTPTK